MHWTLIMAFRPTELNQPIPDGVAHLNLCYEKLGQKTVDELVAIMSAIPPSVASLDLGCNELGRKTGAELVVMMRAIPPVASLNLNGNALGQKPVAELVAIMKAIPQSVTSLNLYGNELDRKTGAELVAIMKAISQSVTSLDLSNNNLGEKTVEELEQISRCLPYVINIHCEELSQEKLTTLNRYSGHGIKATIQVFNEKFPFLKEALPSDLSLHVLGFLWPCINTDIKKVLSKELLPQALPLQELPPQDTPWLNRYRVGAFLALALVAAYAAEPPYKSLVLGLIAAICLISFESNNEQTLRPRL